jgi:hypothetical protein
LKIRFRLRTFLVSIIAGTAVLGAISGDVQQHRNAMLVLATSNTARGSPLDLYYRPILPIADRCARDRFAQLGRFTKLFYYKCTYQLILQGVDDDCKCLTACTHLNGLLTLNLVDTHYRYEDLKLLKRLPTNVDITICQRLDVASIVMLDQLAQNRSIGIDVNCLTSTQIAMLKKTGHVDIGVYNLQLNTEQRQYPPFGKDTSKP